MKVASKYVVLLMLAGLVAALFFQASTTAKTVRVSSADKGVESVVPEAVFTNASPITIPAVGNASPYPSTINVTGLSGTITSVKVTFNGFNHTFPDDLGIVVVDTGDDSEEAGCMSRPLAGTIEVRLGRG